ncbi:peptide methionine sulfoxide reductase msrA/msrB [Butyrivibrio sp. ob235]|uniref:peptide-methionine (S)-S-oxide reductase MsrA n=1 Tax=Butyrivibrio sp. ob235 TaxID=1761780 RepID=UPI0008C608EF|nr:peptide-methionine (S)-S-oxide reductase MsrA [Butyrivibrio sp. ob235]SEL38341.1 peptide methionine sulfoxide reductase msrA/msrB [Butyrivibrio sp. ob235]
METIYFAGGCFWGAQRFFDQFDGVANTEVGYANGPTQNPTYEEVCNDSGHAETVKVEFDPDKISLEELIDYYFKVVDPVSVNKQGGDEGIQYRTGIYYTEDSQRPIIESKMTELEKQLGQKSAIEVLPLENFYTAEEYHQKYLVKNPTGYCHIPAVMFELSKNKGQGNKLKSE